MQAVFQSPEKRIMYDHVIVAFVIMFVIQKKEQIAAFNNSQEVDTDICFYPVQV